MKRYLLGSALVWLGLLSTSVSLAAQSPLGTTQSLSEKDNATATIGVIAHSDFVPDRVKPERGKKIGLPAVLADRIAEHLANSRRFQVVERRSLRRLILEQRFGADLQQSYLDRTLEKAIDVMEGVHGGAVSVSSSSAHPEGRAPMGAGTVGTIGALSDFNDLIHDFKDLGSAAGADFLVLGDLEKLSAKSEATPVPYSTQGRKRTVNTVDVRLRLKVIDAKRGLIAGATSLRTKMVESVFDGRSSDTDAFTVYDHVGQIAAARTLDITFPARIVSLDPLVISRGQNDGVGVGEKFRVEREGKPLKDANGIVIANLKTPVGEVEVTAVQDTVSVARQLRGESFQVGDFAVSVQSENHIAPVGEAVVKAGTGSRGGRELPRLAVGLVKSGSTAKTGSDAAKHTPIFTDTMISRLTQTKRFQLIDRQEVDQLLDEQLAQSMVRNEDLPSAMGTLKGADYLVYGSLASLAVRDQTQQLPNSNRIFKSKIGSVEGNMRIVDARSGDILESRKIIVEEKLAETMDGKRIAVALADAYAEQVVLMLMNAIYPIKVAHVGSDGTVYVNRGDDGGLFNGEVLRAYRLGEAVIDPDTGVQLGQEETPVGDVTLFEVEDAKSKGRMAVGGPILAGDLLKRQPSNKTQRAKTGSAMQHTVPKASGGAWSTTQKQSGTRGAAEKSTVVMGKLRLNPSAKTKGMAKGHIKRLSDELKMKLLNSNRFVVMERAEVDQLLDEKAFEAVAAGGDISDRLRELEGADYLIHGELTNFYLEVKKTQVPFVNKTETTVTRVADGVFSIVNVHTGRVVSSEKINIRETVDEFDDANQIIGDLIARFTTDAVSAIVVRLYPVKVLAMTSDGTVFINRGEDGGIVVGDGFDVMRPGQEMIDPDTGRSFGAAEMKVGQIEVTAVEATRSRARVLSGQNLQSGDILRTAKMLPKVEKPTFIQPAW